MLAERSALPVSTSLIGNSFGPYRVVRLLAASKATLVLEAVNETNQERRALKVLQYEFRNSREQTVMLKREAEIGRSVQHPRLIRIFDFQTGREGPYLVLELFAVPSMKLLARQRARDLLVHMGTVVQQAAEGLGALHQHGWVHRDVKPDNYLVGPGGEVKLIDFALALRVPSGLAKVFSWRTKVQGTRSYMSPEQIRGGRPDPRADIYSLGCTIFELMTGRPPFSGTSSDELLVKHLSQPAPSLLLAEPNSTRQFAELVMRMLAKDPEKRPQSISDFLLEFSRLKVWEQLPPE